LREWCGFGSKLLGLSERDDNLLTSYFCTNKDDAPRSLLFDRKFVIGTIIALWKVDPGTAGLAGTVTLLASKRGGWIPFRHSLEGIDISRETSPPIRRFESRRFAALMTERYR
jgi:hypothetical protein